MWLKLALTRLMFYQVLKEVSPEILIFSLFDDFVPIVNVRK